MPRPVNKSRFFQFFRYLAEKIYHQHNMENMHRPGQYQGKYIVPQAKAADQKVAGYHTAAYQHGGEKDPHINGPHTETRIFLWKGIRGEKNDKKIQRRSRYEPYDWN